MATKKKLLQAAAGAAGGGGLNVEEVFSTYLYNGTATNVSHQIQNGIDLAGEGGLVWIKKRDSLIADTNHHLVDTERGDFYLASNSTNAQSAGSDINTFNSDGWTFDASTGLGTDYNGATYASWTFRKAPKFFDVVTYTGNQTVRTISHNLGSVPACIIIKNLDQSDANATWQVYHRSLSNNASRFLRLNTTDADFPVSSWMNNTAPTSTEFTLGTGLGMNWSGQRFVAYLFAHNDGDGEFGPTADQDVIKCGSYTGNGSSTGPEINLGFEPQWVMIKRSDSTGAWLVIDTMRGWTDSSGDDPFLRADSSQQEFGNPFTKPLATGFQPTTTSSAFNASGGTYIYIAIRRGPMAVPTAATDVFDINERLGGYPTPTLINTGNVVDLLIGKRAESSGGGETLFWDRLRGGAKYLQGDSTAAETGTTEYIEFDTNEGFREGFFNTSHNQVHWTWKRAPNYFDVVAYTGNQTAGHNISHNLGVAPEMMWVKKRDGAADWRVYHSGIGATKYLTLNTTAAAATHTTLWNDTAPTDSVFTLGTESSVNTSGSTYIAYLFASLDGVSKVGSYTGNGTSQNIDCGFSSGARFVLIKRSSNAQNWYIFDTERGIVAGNDPYLKLNATDSEAIAADEIDPLSSGFTVNQTGSAGINFNGHTYIFYAIA